MPQTEPEKPRRDVCRLWVAHARNVVGHGFKLSIVYLFNPVSHIRGSCDGGIQRQLLRSERVAGLRAGQRV
jgi:hypothetical protein